MKKFINRPENVVEEMLQGLAVLSPRTAINEAQLGAKATAQMKPRLGRSSYLQDRVLGHPDPGAMAVIVWLRTISEAFFAN